MNKNINTLLEQLKADKKLLQTCSYVLELNDAINNNKLDTAYKLKAKHVIDFIKDK